jgi:hypothetical protein
MLGASERAAGRQGHGGNLVYCGVPFQIVFQIGSNDFTFQWCDLPTFGTELTHGTLNVR